MKNVTRITLFVVIMALAIIASACSCEVNPNDVNAEIRYVVVTATAIPATEMPAPTATPAYETKSVFGFFRECEEDLTSHSNECICTDYSFTADYVRENCGEYLCSTVINFTTEYGDGLTMWVDDFELEVSYPVQNGDTVMLPDFSSDWEVGSIPFFESNEE